jgi:hypothetical protein
MVDEKEREITNLEGEKTDNINHPLFYGTIFVSM